MSTHEGSCHCGAIKYTVELDAGEKAIECNCSICGRSGSLLMFTSPDKFTLHQGADNLTDYQFASHNIHHTFCKTCGIKSFARGHGPQGPTVAINMRCLADVDVFSLPRTQYDGKSR